MLTTQVSSSEISTLYAALMPSRAAYMSTWPPWIETVPRWFPLAEMSEFSVLTPSEPVEIRMSSPDLTVTESFPLRALPTAVTFSV